MITTLEQTKYDAIATLLADMKALQHLTITNEQKLLVLCSNDRDIEKCIDDMLEEDKENLKVIEQVIAKLGSSSQPQDKTQKFLEKVEAVIAGHDLNPYEKVVQHEALNHQLVMIGLLVHKVAQVLDEEIEKVIVPLNKVSFKNRAHQEQLKSVMLILGTRELTGKDLEQSIWTKTEDAIAALKGLFGNLAD